MQNEHISFNTINKQLIVCFCSIFFVSTNSECNILENHNIKQRIESKVNDVKNVLTTLDMSSKNDVSKDSNSNNNKMIVNLSNLQNDFSSQKNNVKVLNKPKDLKQESLASINFTNEDIPFVIRNIAELFDLNIIIPLSLEGKCSVRLRNVSWQEALMSVLEPINHIFVVEKSIVKIKKTNDIKDSPVRTETFLLQHANAKVISEDIKNFIDEKDGRLGFNDRTNMLIITERAEKFPAIKTLISRLDKPTEQVMIESKFLQINNQDLENLGFDWSVFSADGHKLIGLDGIKRDYKREHKKPVGLTDTAVFSSGVFNILLKNLNTKTKSRVIANPNVVTMDNTRALISISKSYPFPKYTINQQTGKYDINGFEYKDIGTKLEVTPKVIEHFYRDDKQMDINENDEKNKLSNSEGEETTEFSEKDRYSSKKYIMLKVKPSVESESSKAKFDALELPVIDMKTAETSVTIESGYTLAIGGLKDSNYVESKNQPAFPLFRLPGISWLFSNTKKGDNKANENLIIFLTATSIAYNGTPQHDKPFQGVKNIDAKRAYELNLTDSDIPGYRINKEEEKQYTRIQNLRNKTAVSARKAEINSRLQKINIGKNKSKLL